MPTKLPHPQITLTLRELNRATLARQMLLHRESVGAVEAVERLAGLQAQYSPSPYIALWTRLEGFEHDHLESALHERKVVKASLMRWTLHIVSVRDYPFFPRAVSEARFSNWHNIAEKAGLDMHALHTSLLAFATKPRTLDEIHAFLSSQVPHDPDRRPHLLWMVASTRGGLVHTPPSGTWKYFGKNPYITAREWLGEMHEPSHHEAVTHLVRRYLAAFGPATRQDVLQWSGLQKVGQVDAGLQALDDEVVAFRGEDGKVLYDLAHAPRPGTDVPAPPRFLPKWDNLLLAHQNRERVLPSRYRKTVIKVNGDVVPTFLVDGVVAGTWSVKRERDSAALTLEPFEPLDPSTCAMLEEEGEKLIRFIEPDAKGYEVRIGA